MSFSSISRIWKRTSTAPPGARFALAPTQSGYTRDIGTFDKIETGIGANFSTYSLPDAIKPYYGNRPVAVNLFLRLRLRP